jgi:RimJ/RimL family protein N-acetyltransferase
MTTPAISNVVGPVTLSGRFVRLEPLTIGHVPALVEAASGPRDTYDMTYVPEGEAATRAYVEEALSLGEQGLTVPFATVSLGAGRVVGTTRFANFEYQPWAEGSPHQRGTHYPDAVEIGWTWLSAAAQRTPVNTEAKLLMLTHAFETWRVHAVRLKTDRRNERSRAAIERLGAKLDGVLRAHSVGRDGAIRDSAYYSIVEGEWPSVRANLESRLRR